MKDRLVELQRSSEVSSVQTSTWYDHSDEKELIGSLNNRHGKFKDIFMTPNTVTSALASKKKKKTDTDEKCIKALQEKISVIRNDVTKVQQCTKVLREMHTTALMSLTVSKDDEAEIKRLTTRGRAAGQSAARNLSEVEKSDIVGGPAIQRMLAQQTLYARLSFTNAMEQFERELERYSNGLRQYVIKQIVIVGGDLDLDYAQSCIENGKINAFVDNYQLEAQQAKDMLEAVTLRQQELEKLERTIVEVRDLFVETSLLVAAQGSVIDNIEMHVERAAAKAAGGSKQLKAAGKNKRSALKKKVILGAAGSAVAAGLITTLVLL